jgi:hypothetical protein
VLASRPLAALILAAPYFIFFFLFSNPSAPEFNLSFVFPIPQHIFQIWQVAPPPDFIGTMPTASSKSPHFGILFELLDWSHLWPSMHGFVNNQSHSFH